MTILKPFLICKNIFTNFRIISFKSKRDLLLICHLIKKQQILNWQGFFETRVPINAPLIYQSHFFLEKVNIRGKSQCRVIVVSDFVKKF